MDTGYINTTRRRVDNLKYSSIDAVHDAQQSGFVNNISFYNSANMLFGSPPLQMDKNVVVYYTNNNFQETRNIGYSVSDVVATYSPKLKAAFFNLSRIQNGIWDTFDPTAILGLKTKYTYSYYLDTAKRRYDTTTEQQFVTTNPTPTTWDLQAIGATIKRNSFAELSITPDSLLKINFVFNGLNAFTSFINLTNGKCSNNNTGPFASRGINNPQSCRYISGNNTNRYYFDNPGTTLQEGALQILGKLMGDYGHCLQSNDNDVICTWDLWLLVRSIINCLNVVCKFVNGGVGENYKFFKKTHACNATLLDTYPDIPSNNDIDYTIELCNLSESVDDGLSHRGHKGKKKSIRILEQNKKPRISELNLNRNNDNFAPEFGGGGGSNFQMNDAYLFVLIEKLNETCSSLEQFLNTKCKIKINNVEYDSTPQINETISKYISFLKSENLKTYLHKNIDQTLDTNIYIQQLLAWLPMELFFKEETMNTYIPQKISQIFPFLPLSMNTNGYVFLNKFDSNTFYDFVVSSLQLKLNDSMGNNYIAVKTPITFDTLTNKINEYVDNIVLKEQIVSLIQNVTNNNMNNNILIGLLSIVTNQSIPSDDIVKYIFEDVIVDRVDRERVFTLFTNLLLFNGLYVFNYKIIVDFVEMMNMNGGIANYSSLNDIIAKYKTTLTKQVQIQKVSPPVNIMLNTNKRKAITAGGKQIHKKSKKNKTINKNQNNKNQTKSKKNKTIKRKSKRKRK